MISWTGNSLMSGGPCICTPDAAIPDHGDTALSAGDVEGVKLAKEDEQRRALAARAPES